MHLTSNTRKHRLEGFLLALFSVTAVSDMELIFTSEPRGMNTFAPSHAGSSTGRTSPTSSKRSSNAWKYKETRFTDCSYANMFHVQDRMPNINKVYCIRESN